MHAISDDDRDFRDAFEGGRIAPAQFDHVAHLRLAYVLLVEHDGAGAERRMRDALLSFLKANDIPAGKYHATLTQAWLLAVRHFMNRAASGSFAEFAAHSRPLMDSRAMLTHYSATLLFSDTARARFVEPDLETIPG